MTALLVKALPLLICWGLMGLVLFRACRQWRKSIFAAAGSGFALGIGTALRLVSAFQEDTAFAAVRMAVAFVFILLFIRSVAALYRLRGERYEAQSGFAAIPFLQAAVIGFCSALLAGLLCALRFPLRDAPLIPVTLLLFTGPLILYIAFLLEARLSPRIEATADSLFLFLTVGYLYLSAHIPRIDLFAPLTMKVMKFIHDFVHQFFESMLLPDHLFVQSNVWDYIGFLFSNGIGFWGGLFIWLLPPLLILWAVWKEPLPQVAHIRQGAKRRKLLADYLRRRRYRMVVPLLSLGVSFLAVYRSMSPIVEYWDPKPIPISATAGGEVSIPLKGGEYDLTDGKMHKFVLKEGKSTVRFFVLKKGNGHMAVALDACSICRPEGYGQGEGTVICYYCKTLIPLETVGEPGGCNPVPVRFSEMADGVHMEVADLVNTWNQTVQATARAPGVAK